MEKKYIDFVRKEVAEYEIGMPIYLSKISEYMAEAYGIPHEKAADEVYASVSHIKDKNLMPEIRFYQRDICYRTMSTPFGETGIDREQLIFNKYLINDMGYETGLTVLHRMGLTSQMPRERVVVSNKAGDSEETDVKMSLVVRPPKAEINAENRKYFLMLDVLDILDTAPVDVRNPYTVIAEYMDSQHLEYHKLSVLAGRYYNTDTIRQLENVEKIRMENRRD